MRQRTMIAMAVAPGPEVLIADEPTTALDVTVQMRILELLQDLKLQMGLSILLTTHDLGVVAHFADRAAIMFAGRKVEEAPVRELLAAPHHPYTRRLIKAIPRVHLSPLGGTDGLKHLKGMDAPSTELHGGAGRLSDYAGRCAYAVHCTLTSPKCLETRPQLARAGHSALVACWNAKGSAA